MSLTIPEAAAASIEGLDEKSLKKVKGGWEEALDKVKGDFNFKEDITIEYNPLIWHVVYYPVGTRMLNVMGNPFIIIEFSTPNRRIPFDIFQGIESKIAVIAHEIAHLLDDKKWYSMNYKKIIRESREDVSREQRAELSAFFYNPQGIIDSNMALVRVASFLSGSKLEKGYASTYAVLETLGRVGMNRTINIPMFFKEMNNYTNVPRLLRYHITYPFSLAGLIHTPGGKAKGITRIDKLIKCREKIIDFIKDEISPQTLKRELNRMGYCTKTDKNPTKEIEKILAPEILEASSPTRMKKVEKHPPKIKIPKLKNDIKNALRSCRIILEKHAKK